MRERFVALHKPDSRYVRRPHTGSNISKPPTLFEIAKIRDPPEFSKMKIFFGTSVSDTLKSVD